MTPRPDVDPPVLAVREAVARALAEDLLGLGDLSASLVPPAVHAHTEIVARAAGVVAGRLCALETFAQVDPALGVRWHAPDGTSVEPGTVLAEVRGPLRSILTGERTALNFLCHLSGIATATRALVDAVAAVSRSTRVLDTRKTLPGLRALEKAAVRAGGGTNHRGSLSDAVLLKDNHLGGVQIADAVAAALERWPGRMVEVECDRLDQALTAVEAGAHVVMLDNFSPDGVRLAVPQIRERAPRVLVEVSGGASLETAPHYAAAGADLLSVGALTHSSPALDIGLDLRSVVAGAGELVTGVVPGAPAVEPER